MDLLLHNLRTIGTHHCDQTVGEEAAEEIERLRANQEALMRRLLRAGEVFARIERNPSQAVRLAREALFGPDAEPLPPNAEVTSRPPRAID